MNAQQIDRTQAESSTFKLVGGALRVDEAFTVDTIKLIAPGTIIDAKYRIENLLGEGGMGAVYRARHLALNTDVALKTFRSTTINAEIWERFQREARSIAKLESQNIVRVFDFGCDQTNRPYYTMELLQGESLADRIKRIGAMPLPEAMRIFKAIATGMVSAHAQGIVHRDIKPGNIFVLFQGDQVSSAKLVDFGIAKLAGAMDAGGQRLTTAGTIFGSPLYMSPEQSLGEETDGLTDIYSFGCAFFEALTGRPPFKCESALATVMSHQTKPVPALGDICPEREYPGWLQSLLTSMLEKRKEKRVRSFQEILDVISHYERQERKAAGASNSTTKARRLPGTYDTGDSGPQISGEQEQSYSSGKLKKIVAAFIGCATIAGVCLAGVYFSSRQMAKPQVHGSGSQAGSQPSPAISAVSSAKAIKSQNVHKGFYRGVEETEHGPMKVFRFPRANMGYFNLPEGRGAWMECKGEIKFPASSNFVYYPSFLPLGKPEYLAGFEPNDLRSIVFDPHRLSDFNWGDEHVKAFAHISGLESLSVRETEATGDSIGTIGGFKNLTHLDVSDCKITGKDLAKLANLYSLKELIAAQTKEMSYLLNHVDAGRLNLVTLSAKRDGLVDSDMAALAKIKSITSLNLQDNHITSTGIKTLMTLPHLEHLRLYATDIGPDAIDLLAGSKTLKTLELSSKLDSSESREKIKQNLPDIHFVRWVSGKSL